MGACLAELSNMGAMARAPPVSPSAQGSSSPAGLKALASAEACAAARSLQADLLGEVPQLSVQTGNAVRELAAG